MHIHVLGAAPVGHLLAFHLRRHAQHNVSLFLSQTQLADPTRPVPAKARLTVESDDALHTEGGFACEPWDPAVNALQAVVFDESGLVRLSKGRDRLAQARAALSTASPPEEEPIKSLIVTTKPSSVVPALKHLRKRIDASSTLVLLQDGMGIYESLVRNVFRVPSQRPHFILGNSSHAVWKRDAFHVVHHRIGGLKFGIVPDPLGRNFELSQDTSVPYDQRTLRLDDIYAGSGDDARYRSLRDTVAALLETTTMHTRWLPMAAMQRRLLRQCVVHSCVQPLAALNGCRVGALPAMYAAQRLINSVCREASAIFAAQNHAENPDVAMGFPSASGLNARLLYDEVMRYCQRAAGARPQMAAHFDGRVLTDIDYLNGYLQDLGKKFSVPTPTISVLYQMVKLRHGLLQRDRRQRSQEPSAAPYLGQDGSEP
ncbi:6-phosphogluconate dehydrogenase C-terminal domain-like protein [Exidia glandulosa HHB12029]|uniref:6-phosphogluconate dehydrogenase C-terminal domain-like protein n=1 Tax=Exidia glandulosa HHB12029 TaxID=1314781 RepID=A0A165ITB5_EXIGL|nr:6-phosphogluconate dehydrogenase C-terminal domain-like protein [Exidia glandulosa HHB12029]